MAGLNFASRDEAKTVTVTKEVQDAIAAGQLQVIATNPPARFYPDSEDERAEEHAADEEE